MKNQNPKESSTFYPVELNFEEAKYLSDLISLLGDLQFTYFTLKLLKEKYENYNQPTQLHQKPSEEIIINRALFTSALISYTRCFNKGARFGLTTEVFDKVENSEEAKLSHKFYTDLRSKHFAHSVNPFEQYKTAALINDKTFLTLSYLNLFNTGQGDGSALISLTQIAIAHVNKEISKTDEIVMKKVKSLTIEELNKFKKVQMKVAGPENVKDVRKS